MTSANKSSQLTQIGKLVMSIAAYHLVTITEGQSDGIEHDQDVLESILDIVDIRTPFEFKWIQCKSFNWD